MPRFPEEVQQAVVTHALRTYGIPFDPAVAQSPVRIKRGLSASGREITYLLTIAPATSGVIYRDPTAHHVLTGDVVSTSNPVWIGPGAGDCEERTI